MRPQDNEESIDPAHVTGMILVGIGALALLLITVTVVQIIRNPSEADLIQWMMKTIASKEAVLSGNFDGSKFEIEASEAFQYVFLCIVGLVILRLVTSIFMSFIKQGTSLLSLASKANKEKDTTKSSEPPTPRFPPSR